MGTKCCIKCKEVKELTQFYKDRSSRDGHDYKCSNCRKEYNRKYTGYSPKPVSEVKAARSKSARRSGRPNLLRKYGLTEVKYNEMLVEQNGNCKGCGKNQREFKKTLAVDHCHRTGKVRGLLCTQCNVSLGLLNESVATLESLIKYLKENN